jgi:sugar lactone lactonase YvrE
MGDLDGNHLYRLDPDGSIHQMESDVAVSNGIAWSLNEKTMYYQDTMKKRIYAYDFDATTGNIDNRRIFVDTADDEGLPDGMTVDGDGFIWSVRTVAGYIRQYDPNGRLAQKIKMPVKYSTSCIFGGEKLDTLYITSLRTTMYTQPDDVAAEPELGDLFRMKVDATGIPEPKFRG